MLRDLPRFEIEHRHQRLIGERLLEMRRAPRSVDGVAMKAAADLIVDRAARHRVERRDRGLARSVVAALCASQKKIDIHRARELRRAAESAVVAIEPGAKFL